MEAKFYNLGDIDESKLKFAIIGATYKGKWIYVKQKARNTWEIPGGRREQNEDISTNASRELFEETGAINYQLESICEYSFTIGEMTTYGRLFYARVDELGPLPESEIGEVKLFKKAPLNLTYHEVQPAIQRKVLEFLSNKVLSLLEKDRSRNINIINYIKNNPIETYDIVADSVLIRGRSDENWIYISSKSLDEFKQLILGLDEEDTCFAVLEEWMLPYIIKDNIVKTQLVSMKLNFDEDISLPAIKSNIEPLSTKDALYIYQNSKYKEYLSVDYIEDRISNGIGLGIYHDKKLVAWAITHDDGAIGNLNVLDEYRGKGYGTDVTLAIIKKLLAIGEIPFVHIEEDNIKSMKLALKTGFQQDKRIYWIKLH